MSAVEPSDQPLLALYDAALPQVYGYLLTRCGNRAVAEDLTTEVFLAAVTAADRTSVALPWLIGTARHKLVDHWRRQAREERGLHAVATDPTKQMTTDPWDERLDALRARAVLDRLGPHHRAALLLRYVDDLPVPQVAAALGRSLHATEALLVRARSAFRYAYAATDEPRTDAETDAGADTRTAIEKSGAAETGEEPDHA